MPKCKCGCGQETTFNHNKNKYNKFIKGHMGSINRDPIKVEKQRATLLKYYQDHPEERFKNKLSGKDHPMWGKHPSEESIRKNRESNTGIQAGEKNPMYGRKRPEQAGDKNPMKDPIIKIKQQVACKDAHNTPEYIESISGENNPNYGKEMTKDQKQKISQARIKGIANGSIKIINGMLGKHHKPESIQKMIRAHNTPEMVEKARMKNPTLKDGVSKHRNEVELWNKNLKV